MCAAQQLENGKLHADTTALVVYLLHSCSAVVLICALQGRLHCVPQAAGERHAAHGRDKSAGPWLGAARLRSGGALAFWSTHAGGFSLWCHQLTCPVGHASWLALSWHVSWLALSWHVNCNTCMRTACVPLKLRCHAPSGHRVGLNTEFRVLCRCTLTVSGWGSWTGTTMPR